jgi:hypothetical protein
MMNVKEATRSYESWLAKQTTIVKADLAYKHQQMSGDVFSFMRATFYRWLELLNEHCPELCNAPAVLATGDLHVENFGTWRDRESRLVWGVNDFDEAFPLPYTNDLVRLAASAHLAIAENDLAIRPAEACEAISNGYLEELTTGGTPFVLAERHDWLRKTVMSELRDPEKYWKKLLDLPGTKSVPRKALKILERALPDRKLDYRVVHRVAGLGSLGRERFLALGQWKGGVVAREAKARVPSACSWAQLANAVRSPDETILQQAVRSADPCLELHKNWIVRRLAPDCGRVELKSLSKDLDEHKLLEAMGHETANIHLGSKTAVNKVKRDLAQRPAGWLHAAAQAMVEAIQRDWQDWRN